MLLGCVTYIGPVQYIISEGEERVMGRLAEIELRLVSLLDSLFFGLMHACMAAACVVFLWDVITQCMRFLGCGRLVGVGGCCCFYL